MSRNFELSIDEFYHLYDRGVEKRKIFLDDDDHIRFQSLLYACNSTNTIHVSDYWDHSRDSIFSLPKEESIVDIGAYCLMPNHFHLLVKEKIEGGISLFMQKLITGYTMYFNKKYERRGALFEGTFRAKYLDTDVYLKYQYAYIHLNPIGIIDKGWKEKKIADKKEAKEFLSKYLYSSYMDYSDNQKRTESTILNKSAFPEYFAELTEFNSMINEWLNFEDDVLE